MPKDKGYTKKKTNPGAVDDDATKRVKIRAEAQERQLKDIFNDNETDRHSEPIDK
jgi:hypothetical protein